MVRMGGRGLGKLPYLVKLQRNKILAVMLLLRHLLQQGSEGFWQWRIPGNCHGRDQVFVLDQIQPFRECICVN